MKTCSRIQDLAIGLGRYIVRNDVTGATWSAGSAEARLYAIGGLLDRCHSVFSADKSPTPISVLDITNL